MDYLYCYLQGRPSVGIQNKYDIWNIIGIIMADINIQELANALSALARHSNTMAHHIKTVGEVMSDNTRPLETSADAYEKHLKRIKGLNSEEAKIQVELLNSLKRAETSHKKAETARRNEAAILERQVRTAKASQQKLQDAQNLAIKYQGQSSAEARKIQDELTNLGKKLLEYDAKLTAANDAIADHVREQQEATVALADNEKKLRDIIKSDQWSAVFTKIGQDATNSLKAAFNKFVPAKSMGDIIGDAFQGIKKEINTGVNAYTSMAENYRLSTLGMSADDFTTILQQNRTSVLAAGGKEATLGIMTETKDLYKGLMTLDDQAKFAADQMSILTTAGIKPTKDTVKLLHDGFQSLQKTAGLTGPQFNAVMADMASAEGVQAALRAASSDAERQMILKNIATRVAENKAMGFTIEQATNLAKVQAKLASAGPMERFKRGIQMQMLGTAMGVEGGDRVRQIEMKSAKNRSKADEQFLQQYYDKLSRQVSSGMQGNDFGTALLTEQLSNKLDPAQIAGENSPFNSSMASAAKVTNEATKSLGDVSTKSKDLVATLQELNSVLQKSLPGQVGNTVIGGLGSTLLEGAATGATIAGMSKWLGNKFPGMGGPTASPTGGATAGSRVGGMLKSVNKGGLLKGGAGALLGLGLSAGGDVLKEHGYDTAGGLADVLGTSASYAGTGAMIGSVIPGLGTAGGALVGGALGAGVGIYDNFFKDKTPAQEQTSPDAMATALSKQVLQMEQNNDYLKNVSEATNKLVNLTEKMLTLLTMTEADRTKTSTRNKMLQNPGFSSQYATL